MHSVFLLSGIGLYFAIPLLYTTEELYLPLFQNSFLMVLQALLSLTYNSALKAQSFFKWKLYIFN